jgi:beta-galactosidase
MSLRLAIALAAIGLASLMSAEAEVETIKTWRYSPESAEAAETGESVTIPHTWNAKDIQAGKGTNQMSTDGYRRAASWYETTLPAIVPGKREFVRFGAVSSVAEVFLNEEKLGEHRGPTTAFAFELTDKLQKDSPNRLLVKADNTWRPDVAPVSGDFGVPGGIYREVSLIEKDAVCISPLYLGSRGVVVTQTEADTSRAALKVVVHLDRAVAAASKLTFNLLDDSGKIVASSKQGIAVGIGETEAQAELALNHPHLWYGVTDPYLYKLQVMLTAADGSKDREELSIGFRTLTFDKDKGAFLNGKPYPLHGVCRHQDRENESWAVSDEQQREDVAIIREMGANAVRCAHYQHNEAFLDACDRAGLLVWSEVSVIDTVGNEPEAFEANAESQLREIIAQQRHHACVFTWSLFNEIGRIPGADFVPALTRLNAVAKSEDPSRPTVGATNLQKKGVNSIPDLIAFNSYPGWYHGTNGSLDGPIKQYHATAPEKSWAISEYGAGASLSQQDDVLATKPIPAGKWHPEAWQARIHEAALESINRHPELWGTFLWNMFDFASPWRSEGERNGINDKGLVTYDRKTRKDAFYLYQANWSDTPVLHLLARRDNQRTNANTVVRFYANLDNIKVTLNGGALPSPELYGPRAWIIKDVKLRPGLNVVEAIGKSKDGRTVKDRIQWTMKSSATTASEQSATTHPEAQ